MQEYLSLDEKSDVLKAFGDDSLIDVFKGWSPARYNYRKKSAPLDQRISVMVTKEDKESLLREVEEIKKQGERISMSAFIRGRATGNIDISEWMTRAEEGLREISFLRKNAKELRAKRKELSLLLESENDEDVINITVAELDEVEEHLKTLGTQKTKRNVRLAGRATFAEREIIVWRAQRLSLNISDYLRFAIFSHLPNSEADAHLPLEARQRFYISILEVAENGFGEVPSAASCSNCVSYLEELAELREELRVLRSELS